MSRKLLPPTGLTRHGEQRVKERLNIPRRASTRHIERVITRGKRYEDLTGKDAKAVLHRIIGDAVRPGQHEYIIYGEALYVFGVPEMQLVTVIRHRRRPKGANKRPRRDTDDDEQTFDRL